MPQWLSLGGDFVPQGTSGKQGQGGDWGDASGLSLAEARNPAEYPSKAHNSSSHPRVSQLHSLGCAELERLCSPAVLRRRPVRGCACKVNFLVGLSFHRQSSHCLPQKCPGWVGQRPWHPKEKQMQALEPGGPWEALPSKGLT